MIKINFTSASLLGIIVSMGIMHIIFTSSNTSYTAIAQPFQAPTTESVEGNQTISPGSAGESIPYSNPDLGFSLEYPSNWHKEESLSFISPPGGTDNQAPEVISITTELLPTLDFSLDSYTAAALNQVESLQDFELLNSSSVILAGLPGHMIMYSFTDESQTPLQNLQAWTIKDGIAYVITYGGIPEEFDNSLPVVQNMMDSFSLE